MADHRIHEEKIDTVEVRQGGRQIGNFRVLTISLVVVVLALAAAFIYNQFVSPDTETTLSAGESIEDVNPDLVPLTAPETTPAAADPEVGELVVTPQQ